MDHRKETAQVALAAETFGNEIANHTLVNVFRILDLSNGTKTCFFNVLFKSGLRRFRIELLTT